MLQYKWDVVSFTYLDEDDDNYVAIYHAVNCINYFMTGEHEPGLILWGGVD